LFVVLREEHRLRVFENRVPRCPNIFLSQRKIFGLKMGEVTGDQIKKNRVGGISIAYGGR
jgi:hypothetical protein